LVDAPIPEHAMCHRSAAPSENPKLQVPKPKTERQTIETAKWRIAPFNFGTLCLILRLRMSSKAKPAELNFEKAMDRLEGIVEQMESGKLPLEDLIVRYEEGMNLVKVCQERLTKAEQKIEIIARNNAGKPVVKDFEPAAESNNDDKIAEKELKNDEVSLF
jgi:exodeoxyribonuclease VII small subunit